MSDEHWSDRFDGDDIESADDEAERNAATLARVRAAVERLERCNWRDHPERIGDGDGFRCREYIGPGAAYGVDLAAEMVRAALDGTK